MGGKETILFNLRQQPEELRTWMYEHSTPDTRAAEFCAIANEYAILCVKISTIEKHW